MFSTLTGVMPSSALRAVPSSPVIHVCDSVLMRQLTYNVFSIRFVS